MSRSIARGRLFPQAYSTDRRYGRLSVKAIALYPLMWANADDQGRLIGDPEEIKYIACPNIDHITKADIPSLINELEQNELIMTYKTPKSTAIQMLDWWDDKYGQAKMQWAWPSEYPPPDGWKDHLRYKRGAKEVVTINWPVSGETSGEDVYSPQVNGHIRSGEGSGERTGGPSSPPHTPSYHPIYDKDVRRGRGKRNSPEDSGEDTSHSPVNLSREESSVFDVLLVNFRTRLGRISSSDINKVVEREPDSREKAQLRDLAIELFATGGCEEKMIREAFDEVAAQPKGKHTISYVRAVLLDWMGVSRK